MRNKVTISILIVLTIIITLTIINHSLSFNTEIKKIKFPIKKNQVFRSMSSYKWISVKKLSTRLNISEQEIFKGLGIVSQKGDENIPIKELAKKHNKTIEEIKNDLMKIIINHKTTEGKNYE